MTCVSEVDVSDVLMNTMDINIPPISLTSLLSIQNLSLITRPLTGICIHFKTVPASSLFEDHALYETALWQEKNSQNVLHVGTDTSRFLPYGSQMIITQIKET